MDTHRSSADERNLNQPEDATALEIPAPAVGRRRSAEPVDLRGRSDLTGSRRLQRMNERSEHCTSRSGITRGQRRGQGGDFLGQLRGKWQCRSGGRRIGNEPPADSVAQFGQPGPGSGRKDGCLRMRINIPLRRQIRLIDRDEATVGNVLGPDRRRLDIDHPETQVGSRRGGTSKFNPLLFQRVPGRTLTGGVDQLDRPSVDGQRRDHQVAGRPGDFRDDASVVPGECIDQAALADVRRSDDRDPPRFREVTPERRVAAIVPRRMNRMAIGPGIIASFDSYSASEIRVD